MCLAMSYNVKYCLNIKQNNGDKKMTKMTKRNITGKKKGLGRYIKRRKTLTNNKSVKQICEDRLQELRDEIVGVEYSEVRPTWAKDYDLAYEEYLKVK